MDNHTILNRAGNQVLLILYVTYFIFKDALRLNYQTPLAVKTVIYTYAQHSEVGRRDETLMEKKFVMNLITDGKRSV